MSLAGSSSWCARSLEDKEGSLLDSLSDVETTNKSMTIKDYYLSCTTGEDKQMTYQHGLSNYSNVVLGDDRVSYKKSMTQCLFGDRVATESSSSLASPAEVKLKTREKSDNMRRRDYNEAISVCGGSQGVDGIEQIIKLKLEQRSKFGPLQLKRNFKYYDRHGTGFVDCVEFCRSLELMGFQFSEPQIIALFARYDKDCSGTIAYADFMETFTSSNKPTQSYASTSHFDYIETNEEYDGKFYQMQKSELEKVFNAVDREHKGSITPDSLPLLLMALGLDSSTENTSRIIKDMGLRNGEKVDFDIFCKWFMNRNI